MTKFLVAFARTLEMEGGYVNHPSDPGGETKYGISKRSFPDEDIANLTLDRAYTLYEENYWKPLELSSIRNQEVANEIFDTAVNMGTHRAARIAQESMNLLGASLEVDGMFGPVSIQAVNNYDYPDALLKVLNGVQFEHYRAITEAHPDTKQFFRGWMRRIEFDA